MDKIITTILSFDDLLFTASVRQVLPELTGGAVSPLEASSSKPQGEKNSGGIEATTKPLLSMSNPLYEAQTPSKLVSPLKYHTKIDAGIRINELTQEVNMPLLRLVHQIYSIIADAIEYDKEQSSSSSRTMTGATSSMVNTDNKLMAQTAQNQLMTAQSFVNNRDCWRYMAGLIELRDFLPEPKQLEKV